MRRARAWAAAAALCCASLAAASDTAANILVESRIQGVQYGAESQRGPALERALVSAIRREFRCAKVSTYSDYAETIEALAACAKLTGSDCGDLGEAGKALTEADYRVIANQTLIGALYTIEIRLQHVRKLQPQLAWTHLQPSFGDAGALDVAVKDFVDQLARYELCPYRGTIKLAVRTEGNKREDVTTPAFCNESEQTYRRTSSDSSSSEYTWAFYTTGERRLKTFVSADEGHKPWWDYARASAELSGFREQRRSEESVEDPCHTCATTQRQGGRISGRLSTSRGVQLPDPQHGVAIIDLRFSDDGTYTIDVQAGTGVQQASGKRTTNVLRFESTTESWAEGTCDNVPRKRAREESTATLPLRGRHFTAKGTPKDKRLQATLERKEPGAGPDEETTLRWEVDLRRD